jgi:hypothetical protein
MGKMQTYHKSKRFVSQMTTVIRALQYSMNLGAYQGQISNIKTGNEESNNKNNNVSFQLKIPDTEVISLFIQFYKLMFLGTRFSKKMLKIMVDKNAKDPNDQLIMEKSSKAGSDDEGAITSDGAFINDTSDQLSEEEKQEGPNFLDGTKDPYLKIKINANLALRNLFKNYGKIL